MPVFINEMVVRTEVAEPRAASGDGATGQSGAGSAADRQALMEEVARLVREYLERELERLGER